MNKPDARYLNPTTQDYLRQQAIRLREQGKRAQARLPTILECIARLYQSSGDSINRREKLPYISTNAVIDWAKDGL